MSRNAHAAIMRLYPDSAHYTAAYKALDEELAALDAECQALCEASPADAFVIYHPALTYYARAYSLEQIAIESDGKEPSQSISPTSSLAPKSSTPRACSTRVSSLAP